jgi:tRNA A37 methylthiotransferase MiaB
MKRGYEIEELITVVNLLHKKAPKIQLRTSILVGFPGECEKDFNATLNVLKKTKFDEITINRYEDRPLTLSTKMKDKVPQGIIEKRAQFLATHMGCNLLS